MQHVEDNRSTVLEQCRSSSQYVWMDNFPKMCVYLSISQSSSSWPIMIFLPSPSSEILPNMFFSSKTWRKALRHVCNISLITFDKNPCKMFSKNLQNHGSSYIEKSINKALLTWPVLYHREKSKWFKTKLFIKLSNLVIRFLHASTAWNFTILKTRGLIYCFGDQIKDTLIFILSISSKIF